MHASLGCIGRAQTIDSDELPLDDCLNSYYKSATVNSEEFKTIISSLNTKTISLNYFSHSIFRCKFDKMRFYCNHKLSVQSHINHLIQKYRQIQELELCSHILSRLQEFFNLTEYIKSLIIHEQQNLKLSRQYDSVSSSDCRLECLRALCENLRICLNNTWSLCSYVQCNKTLQSYLYKYRHFLEDYMNKYQILTTKIIQLSQEFVSTGLLVLSHSDLLRYTHDDLWEISRGIEEYNIVIEHSLHQKRFKLVRDICLRNIGKSPSGESSIGLDAINKTIDQQLFAIRTLSFSKILYKLALERSLLIAHNVHNYFYQSPILIAEIKSFLGKHGSSIATADKRRQPFDFRDSEFDFHRCLSSMRQLGSPVNDYLRLEYEFTSNFLDIISQSTEMLKELSNSSVAKRKLCKEDTVDNFMAPAAQPPVIEPPTAANCTFLNVKSACKPRKGVQWSDHKDVSLRHQVIGQYLNVIWKLVNDLFKNAKYSNHYLSQCADIENLGSWMLLNANCRKFIGIIIQRIATPDIFPTGFVPILLHQAELIEFENLLLIWDQGICNSILLNVQMPSPNQILADDMSEISANIFHKLQSRSNEFMDDNIKGINCENRETTHPDQVNPTVTIVSVLISTFLKYGEKLSFIGKSPTYQLHSAEIAQLLWPTVSNWAKLETQFSSFINSYLAYKSDYSEYSPSKLGLLLSRMIPGLSMDDKICNMKRSLLDLYTSRCNERINQLLDLGLMRKCTRFDSYNGAAQNLSPSAYAQGAILGVLEPIYRSVQFSTECAQYEALSCTIHIFSSSWLKKLDIITKEKVISETQLQRDVSLISEWILSKESLSDLLKKELLHHESLMELESRITHLQLSYDKSKPEIGFLQRQTSEMGLKVARFYEELRTRSNSPNDQMSTGISSKSNLSSFGNLLTKSGQTYFRSNKSDK